MSFGTRTSIPDKVIPAGDLEARSKATTKLEIGLAFKTVRTKAEVLYSRMGVIGARVNNGNDGTLPSDSGRVELVYAGHGMDVIVLRSSIVAVGLPLKRLGKSNLVSQPDVLDVVDGFESVLVLSRCLNTDTSEDVCVENFQNRGARAGSHLLLHMFDIGTL